MGQILVCNTKISDHPYYLVAIGLYIYSLEELCYVIANETMLIDESIMNEDFCKWIAQFDYKKDLADNLKSIITNKGSLRDFMQMLIESIYYLSKEEKKLILQGMDHYSYLSEAEIIKRRADYLTKQKKYMLAVSEYKKAWKQLPEEEIKSDDLRAAILHNMGFIYAQLFYFKKAALYYNQSYAISGDEETKQQYLAACRFLFDKEEYVEKVISEENAEKNALELEEKITNLLENDDYKYKERLIEALKWKEEGYMQPFLQEMEVLLQEWKENYRRHIV